MKKIVFLILIYCGLMQVADAQAPDLPRPGAGGSSAPQKPVVQQIAKPDSARAGSVVTRVDSGTVQPIRDTIAGKPTAPVDFSTTGYAKVLKSHPNFNFFGQGVFRTISPRLVVRKDGLFYLLGGLFLLLGVVKASFGRYFSNLFTVFFRASLKQKQMREQLLQTPLASLLLNLLFVGVGGLYATFVIQDRAAGGQYNFWLLYGYSVAGLSALYLGKYFILKLLGWTLRMENTTDTYIFIVFICNKVLAIFLLPLLLVAAFARPEGVTVAMTVSLVLVVGIFIYRYISSYGYITREVKASRFHFFLYLCAFEVAPLLLIYKVLLKFV